MRNQIQAAYGKNYMVEIGVNMKSFCNNYYNFYYSGHIGQSFKLIRVKSLVSSINFNIPIPYFERNSLEF